MSRATVRVAGVLGIFLARPVVIVARRLVGVAGTPMLLAAGFPLLPPLRLELGYALMVEQHGNSAWGDEHGNTVTDDHGPRVIDFEAMTPDKLNGKDGTRTGTL